MLSLSPQKVQQNVNSERILAMNTKTISSLNFTAGDVVAVKVTAVRYESGMEVQTVKGCVPGVIKMSCFGATREERKVAMAQYAIGQQVIAKVCAYYEDMQRLVMVLASSEDVQRIKAVSAKKPAKRLLPKGTPILIDSANVLGRVHDVAMEVTPIEALRSLDEGLLRLGYEPIFFMEYRTYGWAMKAYSASAEAFDAFCKEKVGFVTSEADEVLLQTAFSMPDAVILTNDRFRDYAEAYPEIVGTKRMRGYSVVGGAYPVVSIPGIKELIVLQTFDEVSSEEAAEIVAPEIACIEERLETPVTPRACCQKVPLYELRRKAAQHDADAFECLATCYAEGTGVRRNFRKSATLDRAAQEAKKREQQMLRRAKRGNYRCYKCCATSYRKCA